jgi:hypothetical protein
MAKVLTAAVALVLLLVPVAASAQRITISPVVQAIVANEARDARRLDGVVGPQSAAPGVPIVYSDGYRVRLKIHKVASVTMLPLFGAQALLGKKLYNNPTPRIRQWHSGVAWGVAGLFAVNSVTGTWNLIESRKDPSHRKLRVAHGLLMLAADAGFVATAFTAPDDDGGGNYLNRRSLHKNLAITSISTATIGYLIMLFGNR